MTHTATPWGFDEPEYPEDAIYIEPLDAKGDNTIATLGPDIDPLITPQQHLANARMIIKSVNHHDELVAALSGLVEWIDDSGNAKFCGNTLGHARRLLARLSEQP
jgi:hypothetical protein